MPDKLLASHREAIDAIDFELLQLMNQRAEHARAIGLLKDGGVVYRPEREAQVLRRIQENNPGPLPNENVARLFREIMSICLALERPLTIAYLGSSGEAAAMKHFGHAANTMACQSIDEAFMAVERREADYMVVPIENATDEEAFGQTLNLMITTPLKICGEVIVRAPQSLLSKTNEAQNTLRFGVLGHESVGPSGHDKTALILSAQHEPDKMYSLIKPLVKNGLSMTRLESRSFRTGLGESLFFIDLEGHQEDAQVKAVLTALKNETVFLKILGSYPGYSL
jgi:chorismate mutase-like protein